MAGSSTDDYLAMKRRSLILSAPREGRFFLREYFLPSLQSVIGKIPENVVSFGPLAKNNEWHIVLKSDEAKNKLLSAGQLLVKGAVFWVRSADSDQFRVRVLWAPPYLPNEVITSNLARSGKVVSISHELSVTKGFEGVRTGVRTVIMSGKKDDIPYVIIIVNDRTGDKYELLVTCTGRQPLCLRCRELGHFRRECVAPHCRFHGTYDHSSEECSTAKSYAGALTRKKQDKDEPEVADETEEEGEVSSEKARDSVTKVSETGYATVAGKKGVADNDVADNPADDTAEVPASAVVDDAAEVAASADCEDSVSSDGEDIGDIIPDSEEGVKDVGQKEVWSLVNSKRKRARDREPAVASQGLSSPLPGSPPTGKLVIDETCSDDSERAKFKKKCNDASSDNDST